MAVDIQQLSDRKLLVNNKLVYIDMDSKYVAKIELTTAEENALNEHLINQTKDVGK